MQGAQMPQIADPKLSQGNPHPAIGKFSLPVQGEANGK